PRRLMSLFALTTRRPPASTPFPYTTLFRSMAGTSTGSEVWFRPRGLRLRPGQAVRWVNRDAGNVHTATAYHPDNGKPLRMPPGADRKSTRLNSSHVKISYAVFCLKKKKDSR